MTGHRTDRVADRIRRELALVLQEDLRDPRVGFVTLTDVKISPDLRHAVVFVTLLGGGSQQDSLAALNRAAPFLRRSLAQRAGLRFTPELKFVYDDAAERGRRVEDILQRLRREQPDAEPAPPGADLPGRD